MPPTHRRRVALLTVLAVALACVPEARPYLGDSGVRVTRNPEPEPTVSDDIDVDAGREPIVADDIVGDDDDVMCSLGEDRSVDGGANADAAPKPTESDSSTNVVSSMTDSGPGDLGDPDASSAPQVVGQPEDAGATEEDSGFDDPEPSGPVNWNGTWGGLTSDGTFIRFSLFDGAVLSVAFDWIVPTDTCIATGGVQSAFQAPIVVETSDPFTVGPIPAGDIAYTLSGGFAADGIASGEIDISHPVPGCAGSARVTWEAAPVVCGNGRIEWPETCDDGSTVPGDGCSELCHVLALAESEPNDTPMQAGDAHEADVILTGSLGDGTDVDVFTIRNPHAGPIAVSFETHGQAIGTCRVDTFLEILDGDGQVLAEDDDGGRAWFCSAMSFSLQAAETVYVRVSSTSQQPTEAYAIAVNFQEG